MTPYAEGFIFSNEELWAYEVARVSVPFLPDATKNGRSTMRCHEVAQIVARLLHKAEVVDGKYGAADHSWVVHPEWHVQHILDVYAVGMVPPVQLVDIFPVPKLYRPGERHAYDLGLVQRSLEMMRGGVWQGQVVEALMRRGGAAAVLWWRDQPGHLP